MKQPIFLALFFLFACFASSCETLDYSPNANQGTSGKSGDATLGGDDDEEYVIHVYVRDGTTLNPISGATVGLALDGQSTPIFN